MCCPRSKECDYTIKLGVELRDLWAIARDQLMSTDVNKLVWWGLTVVEKYCNLKMQPISRFIVIYVYECYIKMETRPQDHSIRFCHYWWSISFGLNVRDFSPSSREDLYNLELCYLVFLQYKKKLNETKNMLCEFSRKKVQLITRKKDFIEIRESQDLINFVKGKKCRHIKLRVFQIQRKRQSEDGLQIWQNNNELQELTHVYIKVLKLSLGERRRVLEHLEREVSRISMLEPAEARNQAVLKKMNYVNPV